MREVHVYVCEYMQGCHIVCYGEFIYIAVLLLLYLIDLVWERRGILVTSRIITIAINLSVYICLLFTVAKKYYYNISYSITITYIITVYNI